MTKSSAFKLVFLIILSCHKIWCFDENEWMSVDGEASAPEDRRSESPFVKVSNFSWSYRDQYAWIEHYPYCGPNMTRQSPINLNPRNVLKSKLDITFHRYNIPLHQWTVVNTGWTIQFNSPAQSLTYEASISGLALKSEKYALAHIQFHWGMVSGEGSEHSINTRYYEMEVHLLHFNRDKYSSFTKALGKRDGIAIIAFFVNIGPYKAKGFVPIVTGVRDAVYKHKVNYQFALRRPFVLKYLMPDNSGYIIRYEGSLTYPPCYGNVTWLIMEKVKRINLVQMEAFRRLRDEEGNFIGDNVRHQQKWNGRGMLRFSMY